MVENPRAKAVIFEKIQEFKGELDEEVDRFILPAHVQVGEEYIVFMTKLGSVVSKSQVEWDTIYHQLQTLKPIEDLDL
jgi:hypothetical protein